MPSLYATMRVSESVRFFTASQRRDDGFFVCARVTRNYPQGLAGVFMKRTTTKSLRVLVNTYKTTMDVMEHGAERAIREDGRAYGGFIRMAKGKFQEWLTERLVQIAWADELGGDSNRLLINSEKVPIPLREDYIKTIKDPVVKSYVYKNRNEFAYGLSVDKHVFVDGIFRIGVESKAYTENAMIKRILVDFYLLKTIYPTINCFLLQLESQLGGDYGANFSTPLGSAPTHTLMSYFKEVDLNIITLLEGDRKVDRPINKPEFSKELKIENLEFAIARITSVLKTLSP